MKLHEATQMFVMVDYVREMTVRESSKYGKYGSFEHLLFLFGIVLADMCPVRIVWQDMESRLTYRR